VNQTGTAAGGPAEPRPGGHGVGEQLVVVSGSWTPARRPVTLHRRCSNAVLSVGILERGCTSACIWAVFKVSLSALLKLNLFFSLRKKKKEHFETKSTKNNQ